MENTIVSDVHKSCFVYGCFSTAANKPNLGFHKFPRKKKRNIIVVKKNGDRCIYDRRQLWIEALNIGRGAALAIDGINVYVCSLHFAREDFYYNQDITGRRYLKEFAIPRRNLPARHSSVLTTKFRIRPLHRIRYRGYFNINNPDGRKLTVPRKFLGSNWLKEKTSVTPSYTKTVWIARKPNAKKDDAHQVNNDTTAQSTISSLPPEGNIQNDEVEDDEPCTILDEDNVDRNSWFTSELIIKEEPMSDSEQVSQEAAATEDNEGMEEEEEDDDDDSNSGEHDKLVINNEENEEERVSENESMGAPKEASEDMEVTNEERLDSETEDLQILEENGSMEDFTNEDMQYNSYAGEERLEEQDYDVTVVHVNPHEATQDYEYPCRICGEEECEGHHKTHPRDNYFVCLVCSDIFPSQKLLAAHSICHQELSEEELRMHEERTKSLTCEFCGRVLSTKSTLREHIMIHTGEKPHKCLLCGKSFRHKANLVVHVNGHAVVSTYKCKKCNKAFTKKMDFENHLQYHVDASGNPLVCKICNAVFKSQRTLYNHAQLHSRKGIVRPKKRSNGPKESTHKCKICGKILSTKATLKEHMMIHSGEKPHVCNICGRTIRHKANFVVHVQTHGQGKSFECDMCDEAFMRKSDLTQHKQMSHSKSKLLRCPICSEVFKSPQKFNRHMEIHESVVYMNETEEYGFQPHLLEGFLEGT